MINPPLTEKIIYWSWFCSGDFLILGLIWLIQGEGGLSLTIY